MSTTLQLCESIKVLFGQKNYPQCLTLLQSLKIEISQLPLFNASSIDPELLFKCRECLEFGALSSIYTNDIASFEKFMIICKTFYFDLKLPESSGMHVLLGLDLMLLLSCNRIAEFHASLEKINVNNPYIQFPIQIEQSLMEGSYHKISALRNLAPSQEYLVFIDSLMNTIRSEIASCVEKAYNSISLQQIPAILLARNEKEVVDCVNSRNWKIANNTITFATCSAKNEIPAFQMASNVLHYAKEMEKIV